MASSFELRGINSSYGCTYYPWVKIYDEFSDSTVWAPPSIIALGVMANTENRDALWFATIAGMFKTYNVSSNGLDGLVPLYYHVLSYYVAGSLSSLIGINTITFYHVAYPILIIPISLLAFIYCVKQTSKYFSVLLKFKIYDFGDSQEYMFLNRVLLH